MSRLHVSEATRVEATDANVIYNSSRRGAMVGWGVACDCAGVKRQYTIRRA